MSKEKQEFEKRIEELYHKIGVEDPLARFRTKAWDHFLELGLPTRKTAEFQYVPLRKLYSKQLELSTPSALTKEQFSSALLPEAEKTTAIFVNGRFDPMLSRLDGLPKRAVAIPLFEAFRTFGSFLNNQAGRSLQEESDSFAVLNAAFSEKALFIYLPPNTICERPIEILHIVSADNALISPRIEFFCGALSQATVLFKTVYLTEDNASVVNGCYQFTLEEGARVHCERKANAVPKEVWQMEAIRAVMKKDSYFHSLMASEGAETVRDDYKITLVGPNAETSLNGCWALRDANEMHTHVKIDHQAPFCRSNQLFKGVLGDVSKSSFEGKIFIQKPAQKTEAYQLNQNLLLQEGAQAYTKPNLEIYADDVKASHGATVGRLSEEELFYLETRGLSKEDAKKLLVKGYTGEVLNRYVYLRE